MKSFSKRWIWIGLYLLVMGTSIALFLIFDLTPDVELFFAILMMTVTGFLSYYLRRSQRP